ncbi:MAG: malate/lactate/ureidoglycolate dehydrogenase [Pseudomonadota bacterium]|nr:malate/lactate/ureidoglycolate dehydrogenase [Pseudomonadota bacterium]
MIISHKKLGSLVRLIFHAMGCHNRETTTITDHLVTANLMGHDSHGVGMIPIYVQSFLAGELKPNVSPNITVDNHSILVFDGKKGFGQSVTRKAMQKSIARCKETGLVLMGIHNSGHMGRIGSYGEQSVKEGLVSIHFVNVTDRSPSVAPFGGSQARFGTNPICISIPRGSATDPLILDFATSKVAVGKIRAAINKKEQLPDGWVIDYSGAPTNDPRVLEKHIYSLKDSEIPEGAVLPMGDHKGYGLSLFCEILGGIMSGGKTIQPENIRSGGLINNMLSIIFDPEKLQDKNVIHNELEKLIKYVESSPIAAMREQNKILLPGELERKKMSHRRKYGIEIDDKTYTQIVESAEFLGIKRSSLVVE